MRHEVRHVKLHVLQRVLSEPNIGWLSWQGDRMKVQARHTRQKRLHILSDDEREALYGKPHFTPEERLEYFTLSPVEKAALEPFHSLKSRIYCILQLGYFKARQMFFVFSPPEVAEDVRYIQERYFPHVPYPGLAMTKVTRLKQQRVILALCNYQYCGTQERQQLVAKARQAAMVCGQPVYVFRELLHYLTEHRLVAPGYSFLQETVGKALLEEQQCLITLVCHHLTPGETAALNRLLEDAQGLYEITLLKREPKDFSWREMAREIRRGQQLHPFSELAKKAVAPSAHLQ
jgi:hypothetical protein